MSIFTTAFNGWGRGIVIAIAGLATLCLPSSVHAAEQAPGELSILRARDFNASSHIVARASSQTTEKAATFTTTYTGSVPAEVQVALEHSLDLWAAYISSPVAIAVEVQWQSLGPGVLGAAGAVRIHRDFPGAPIGGTWYVDALADALAGSDQSPGSPDILIILNSDTSWYLGTDGNTPAGTFDLVTVGLHELAHGLGFSGSFDVTNGAGSWGFGTERPLIYDSRVVDAAGRSLADMGNFGNPSAGLAAALESGALSFAGPRAAMANAGVAPRLYAPLPWLDGMSLSHFDEATFPAGDPSSLMTPFLAASESIHDPGEVAVCLLADLGWQTPCGQITVGSCEPSARVLCLDDVPGDRRFRVSVQFDTVLGGGLSGAAGVAPLAPIGQPRGGTFSFVAADNPELLVKVLNGCQVNGHYWVFFGGATTIGFELTVEDTVSGESRVFSHPDLQPVSPVTAVDAFATCP